jgi:hypothetical protein
MKIIANFVNKVLPILGAALVLLSMATVHPVRAEWRKMPTDKQQINMQVPGMEHWNPGYWKNVDDSTRNKGTAYHTKWRLIEDFGIHAYMTYQTRARGFYYVTIKYKVDLALEEDYTPSFDKEIYTYISIHLFFSQCWFSKAEVCWISTFLLIAKAINLWTLLSSKR